jgi:hypothetical protein
MHLNSWLSKHELLSQILSYELRNMTQGQVHMDVIQESLLMSMSPSTISCIHRATFLYEHVLSDYSEVQLVPALLIANRLVTSTLVLYLTELLAGYRSDTQSLELPRIASNCLGIALDAEANERQGISQISPSLSWEGSSCSPN